MATGWWGKRFFVLSEETGWIITAGEWGGVSPCGPYLGHFYIQLSIFPYNSVYVRQVGKTLDDQDKDIPGHFLKLKEILAKTL